MRGFFCAIQRRTAKQDETTCFAPRAPYLRLSWEISRTAPRSAEVASAAYACNAWDYAHTIHRLPRLVTACLHGFATARQDFVRHRQVHLALRNVDLDEIAVLHQADRAAFGGFRRGMSDDQPGRPTGEPTVGKQRAGLAQALRLQVRRGIEHFLHARATLGTFVANHDNVTSHDLVAQNGVDGFVLAFEDTGAPGEDPLRFVHASGLDDAALLREVAVEHGETAVLRIRVLLVPDAAGLSVGIQ